MWRNIKNTRWTSIRLFKTQTGRRKMKISKTHKGDLNSYWFIWKSLYWLLVIECDRGEDKNTGAWCQRVCDLCVTEYMFEVDLGHVCLVGTDTTQIKNWSVRFLMNQLWSLTRFYVSPHACTRMETHRDTSLWPWKGAILGVCSDQILLLGQWWILVWHLKWKRSCIALLDSIFGDTFADY